MRALALEHCRSNQLGAYGEVLAERGLDVDVVRLHENESLPDWRAYDALVVMGGPMSAYDEAEHPWLHDDTNRDDRSEHRASCGLSLLRIDHQRGPIAATAPKPWKEIGNENGAG